MLQLLDYNVHVSVVFLERCLCLERFIGCFISLNTVFQIATGLLLRIVTTGEDDLIAMYVIDFVTNNPVLRLRASLQ